MATNLWKPRETLRDWGKTKYTIVPNWRRDPQEDTSEEECSIKVKLTSTTLHSDSESFRSADGDIVSESDKEKTKLSKNHLEYPRTRVPCLTGSILKPDYDQKDRSTTFKSPVTRRTRSTTRSLERDHINNKPVQMATNVESVKKVRSTTSKSPVTRRTRSTTRSLERDLVNESMQITTNIESMKKDQEGRSALSRSTDTRKRKRSMTRSLERDLTNDKTLPMSAKVKPTKQEATKHASKQSPIPPPSSDESQSGVNGNISKKSAPIKKKRRKFPKLTLPRRRPYKKKSTYNVSKDTTIIAAKNIPPETTPAKNVPPETISAKNVPPETTPAKDVAVNSLSEVSESDAVNEHRDKKTMKRTQNSRRKSTMSRKRLKTTILSDQSESNESATDFKAEEKSSEFQKVTKSKKRKNTPNIAMSKSRKIATPVSVDEDIERDVTGGVSPHKRVSPLHTLIWHPKKIKRIKEDFNELDLCLTVYQDVITNFFESCSNETLATVLTDHQKYFNKELLKCIKRQYYTSELEKLKTKEKLKKVYLEKKMAKVRRNLEKAHASYQEVLFGSSPSKDKKTLSKKRGHRSRQSSSWDNER